MADIRIKDLTTTASSTASDDFIAVDGTTNGTRKLNAFSPTFGGNATVTGTLTVNTSGSVFNTRLFINSAARNQTLTDGTAITGSNSADDLALRNDSGKIYLSAGGAVPQFTLTTTALTLSSTTASTTTSTGALVVGNGTSGGLGVGGAANIGGALSMYGEDFTIHNVGYGSWTLRNTAGSAVLDLRNGAGSWLTFPNLAGTVEFKTLATTVKVAATTASTSTSSGALVVSGGVGVAGKVTSTALGLANTSQSIPAWGDVGAQLSVAGAVITDTTSSGTVSRFVSNSIAASSIAASSPTTYTQAATLFIAAGPTANTNVTITNSYALFIAGGRINFGGLPTSSAGLQAGTLWNDAGTLKVA